MKIAHVLAYYGDYLGGIQLYVKQLAERQKKEGHDVKIITSGLYGSQKEIGGIEIVRCKSWFSAFRTPFMPSLPFKLLKEKCDVVHAHLPSPGLDLSVAFKKMLNPKTKLIVTIHNYSPRTTLMKRIFSFINDKILIRPALKRADKIIFTTKGFPESLNYKFDKNKVAIIPLGVDLNKFRPKKNYNKNQIIFVGRLVPEKGLHILVKAVKLIIEKYPNLTVIAIVSEVYGGFNKYGLEVKNDGKGFLKISKNVPHDKIHSYYSNSNILVMPSLDLDSFGYVLIEAMACGCPVITSNLPGPSSIVNKKVGLVVEKGNIKKTANAILKLLGKNELRKNCRKYVENNFDWNKINKKILEVYEK